ncbi:MAG: family 20 glycosylhydrolase [Bacteroidota bacterium]
MRPTILYLLISLSLLACDQTTNIIDEAPEASLLPHPKTIQLMGQGLALSSTSKLYAAKPELAPLLELFSSEVERVAGVRIKTTQTAGTEADIVFDINPDLSKEAYQLTIDQRIQLSGGSYEALAMAKTTLLQLAHKQGDQLVFPRCTIQDEPDATYRGLMIDLARKWHSAESVKQLIDLAAFYKIKFLHLHFTDHQSFTFPSKSYPRLATAQRHYTKEELTEMEAYSQVRGVTIIPELEVPGHAEQFVKQYPEIFAIEDTATNSYIINMGNEAAYEAIDNIVGEMAEIFQASPYFHMGGDEAYFEKVMEDPQVQTYIEKHQIGEDVHELYRHFLVRMNEIVKKYNKQMCVWEGFGPEGEIAIPKDIIVFEFETNRYLPNLLVEDGYTVVNTSWQPLYVVNKRKWSPTTIYDWNMWRWENWWDQAPSFTPIQVEKTPLIIGAQMCAWEQPEESELPSLRRRVPAFVERIWNLDQQLPHEHLLHLIEQTDQRLSRLIGDDRQDQDSKENGA